jgi:hypothetical protein
MENLENKTGEKEGLYDFARKSVMGAAYRVGASFTLDALYLTAAGALTYYMTENTGSLQSIISSASDFVKNLDPGKLARVAAFVVGINFVDYKYNVTEKLDSVAKSIESYFRK